MLKGEKAYIIIERIISDTADCEDIGVFLERKTPVLLRLKREVLATSQDKTYT